MFYTNAGTPLKLTSGDTYHDAAIAVGDAIVGAASSPWTEVTGAGPTPTWLQPYASTVVAATSSATSNGFGYHYTMYHDTDPGLSEGTPYCVLVRIVVAYHGLALCVCDTAVADPDLESSWSLAYTYPDLTVSNSSTYGYDEVGGKFLSWSPSSTLATVSDVDRIEINIWIWDECFVVACKDNDNSTYNYMGGGGMVWSPTTTGVTGGARADCPHVWHMNMGYDSSPDAGATDAFVMIYSPGWDNADVHIHGSPNVGTGKFEEKFTKGWSPEVGVQAFIDDDLDINGDNVLARLQFMFGITTNANPAVNELPSYYSGIWTEGPRLCRQGIASAYLATVTIDGDDYYELKTTAAHSNHYFGRCCWIIPNVDLTV